MFTNYIFNNSNTIIWSPIVYENNFKIFIIQPLSEYGFQTFLNICFNFIYWQYYTQLFHTQIK